MTARRRRKSGSGPSATALIAWAGGAGVGADVSLAGDRTSLVASVPTSRLPLIARGRGLAAGTLLACGSVLAVAAHTADSSFTTPKSAPPPRLATAGPLAVSGGATASLGVAEPWAAAASASSGQALGGTYSPSGAGSYPAPLVLHASGSPPSAATLLLPLNLPGVGETRAPESVDRPVAPVPQVPETPVGEPSTIPGPEQVVTTAVALLTPQRAPGQDLVAPAELAVAGEPGDAPLEEGAQPAMTMLSPPLPVLARA